MFRLYRKGLLFGWKFWGSFQTFSGAKEAADCLVLKYGKVRIEGGG